MIRFFRTLRQRLLAENRVSRYLLYALGEIALVMIGILLALQVNNWNETRNNKLAEQKYLREILTSLEKDQGRTRYLKSGRAQRKHDALQHLLGYLHADSTVADSTLKRAFFTSLMTLSFSYDKGNYESLKAFGLDKISSDSLRPNLVRFYEVTMPLSQVFLEGGEAVEKARREDLLQQLRTFTFQKADVGTWFPMTDIDFANLKEQEAFKELIWLEMEVSANYLFRLENILERFEVMIAEVTTEIQPAP